MRIERVCSFSLQQETFFFFPVSVVYDVSFHSWGPQGTFLSFYTLDPRCQVARSKGVYI